MEPYFDITTAPLIGGIVSLRLAFTFPVSDQALSDPAYLSDTLRSAKHYACQQTDKAFWEWAERHTTQSAVDS
jgi:hypothetical protein